MVIKWDAPRRARRVCRDSGLAYLGLLFAIAIIGIMLGTVGVVWSTQIRREKEAQLLFAGDQIRAAIGHYYAEGHVYPPSLADLLEDKRYPQIHRHLRRLYYDPLTANTDWQLIFAPGNGIMGVASASKAKPIKQTNFSLLDSTFENAECYCDWQFVFSPRYGNQRRVRAIPPR